MNNKKIEAVIFDWAGTTVDYGCFAPVNAFMDIFKEYGIEPTIEETRKPMGMLKWDHIKTMMSMPRINSLWKEKYNRDFTDKDIDEMHDKFAEKLLKSLHSYADPKPYVLETVAALKKEGIKIGSTTGYTDEMMAIVTKAAKENGYEPDTWFSPDSTNEIGRPYPFMVFKNMEALKISSVGKVIKVGDTISDILEGKNAGVCTIGVIEGSSEMALTEEEFNSLSEEEKTRLKAVVTEKFKEAGADYVIDDIRGVLDFI